MDDAREAIRRLHERSGEVELLISGALLFGLLQIPGRMDGWWDAVTASVDRSSMILLFMLYIYVRIIVVTLIAAFGLHLVTRAYWVGLIGLDSVFPDGVDWDQVRYGPVAKDVYRRRLPSLAHLAHRADQVGSAIFSVAFWLIAVFLFSIVFGAVFGALSWALSRWVVPGVPVTTLLVGFALVVGSVPAVAITLERLLGDRLRPGGAAERFIRASLAGYYRLSGGVLYAPIQFTLFSRIPKRVVWPAAAAGFLTLFAVVVGGEAFRRGDAAYSADPTLPTRGGARSVAVDHFADTRDPASWLPYIQSDIVEGPYVRLTVPLVPVQYTSRLHAACPDLVPLGELGLVTADATEPPPAPEQEEELLRCFGEVWSVGLDGADLTVAWDFQWTVRRGPSALLTYIPTAELPPGPHVLRIERAPRPPDDDDDEEGRPAVYLIRFRI